MIDSIGSTSGASGSQRMQATGQIAPLRNNVAAVNAIVQTQQRSSSTTFPVTALAVPQTTKSGNTPNAKVPRGSLVDLLA